MFNILIYSDELANIEFNASHPFKPARAKQLLDLMNRYTLIHENNQKVVPPSPLAEDLLYLFHDREYIDVLKKCDRGDFSIEMLSAGIGTSDNPVFKGMYRYAMTATGGTYQGAMMLLGGEARAVFNPHGGFHHAGRDHAEGFCYLNDIAIAATDLIRKGKRIAYIDIDVHHGNGVQDAFYTTDEALTISLHESGWTLYPGTGFEDETGEGKGRGYNVNIPFLSETDDEVYLYAFEAIVPPLLKSFKPDIVFLQVGGDAHRDDPLGHLNLTTNGYIRVVSLINDLSPQILMMGGGGYNLFKTAALWALAWASLCGLKPHDHYAGIVGGMMYGPEKEAGSLYDTPFSLTGHKKEECFNHARKMVAYLRENIFPIHNIS